MPASLHVPVSPVDLQGDAKDWTVILDGLSEKEAVDAADELNLAMEVMES